MHGAPERGAGARATTAARSTGAALGAALLLALGAIPAAASSWQRIGPHGGRITSLAVDPSDPATVYAANGTGLWKTLDGGATWSRSDSALLVAPYRLAIDPTATATVYAGGTGGVARSTDGGATWVLPQPSGTTGDWPFNDVDIAIDPQNPGTLYAASGGVFKSLDGGTSWTRSSTGLPQVPVTSLTIDSSRPAVLYAGTYAGVFKSTDSGASWQPARTGLGATQVLTLAADPAVPGRVYAAAQPAQGAAPRHFFTTSNGGVTWIPRRLAPDNPRVTCLAATAAAPGTVYACGSAEGVFRSTDGGVHWAPSDTGLETMDLDAVAIAPSLASRVYAGVAPFGNLGPAVYFPQRRPGGAAWSPASGGLGSPVLSAVVADPSQPGKLFVLTNADILVTTDDGGHLEAGRSRAARERAPCAGDRFRGALDAVRGGSQPRLLRHQ